MSEETKTQMAAPAIVPVLRFADGARTVDWLCEAFGFERAMVMTNDDGTLGHVELALGRQLIMGGSADGEGQFHAVAHPPGRAMLYVALEGGVEQHHERAVAAGAEVVIPLERKPYGALEYTARDPEGNIWSFGDYVPEVPA